MKKINRLHYKILISLLVIFSLLTNSLQVFALSEKRGSDPSGKSQRYVIEQAPWLDPTDVDCAPTGLASGTIASNLPADFPEPYRTLFTKQAAQYNVDVFLMAAIFMTENFGFSNGNDYTKLPNRGPDLASYNGGWPTAEESGATGPWQWLPQYFPSDADGDNDGVSDIQNLTDAGVATAKKLSSEGIVASGNEIDVPGSKNQPSIAFSLGAYVGGGGYNPGNSYVVDYQRIGIERYKYLQSGGSVTKATASNPPAVTAQAAQQPSQTDNSTGANSVYILGDSLSVGLKAAKIEQKFTDQSWGATVNANGGRSISSPGIEDGGGSFESGLQVVDTDSDKIRQVGVIVIALGTNIDSDFQNKLTQLLDKFKNINPTAKYYWVNMAASGNSAGNEAARTYHASGRPAAAANNKILTDQQEVGSVKYKVINQYSFVWGAGNPEELANKNYPDPNGLLLNDGVHYTGDGYSKYADFIVEQVKSGGGGLPVGNNPRCDDKKQGNATMCVDDIRLMPINDGEKVAEVIDSYIEENSQADAPLRGLGDKFLSGAERAGVNPFFIVYLAQRESSFGRAIPTGSFNAFGRTALDSQPHVEANGRKWYRYDSWEESLDGGGVKNDHPTYIKEVYIDDGLTTIRDVMMKYAPPNDGNDTESYIQGIKDSIKKMVDAAGAAVTCGSGGSGTFEWPIAKEDQKAISTCWNTKRATRGKIYHHSGLDIVVNRGTNVYAVADGIAKTGNGGGYGHWVSLDHGEINGQHIYSFYGHNYSHEVTDGQQVKKGDVVALANSEGYSTGDHLHFNIQTIPDAGANVSEGVGTALNPLDWLVNDGRSTKVYDGNNKQGTCIPGPLGSTGYDGSVQQSF